MRVGACCYGKIDMVEFVDISCLSQLCYFSVDASQCLINRLAYMVRRVNLPDCQISGQIKQIPALIKLEALQRISYILRSYFFNGNSVWNDAFGRHIKIIKKTIAAEAEFLDLMKI